MTATVQVASPDRAPVDGTVAVTATTDETCSDNTPAIVGSLTVAFACDLTFASAGTRDVSAMFAACSSHDDSSGMALSHTINPPPPPEIVADGFA